MPKCFYSYTIITQQVYHTPVAATQHRDYTPMVTHNGDQVKVVRQKYEHTHN